jgi:nucleotide-binding universal stress UspA family protein
MKTTPSIHNGAARLRIKNILVPIDFSARSINAIATAKRLAQRLDANVHLAHAQEYSYPAVMIGPGAPMLVAPMTDFEQWREAAEKRLVGLAKANGLTGTCRAEIGSSPFDTLCWIAGDVGADLVVTSTHGRTGMKRAFLGSTAERLVQHSPCPVYVDRKRKTRSAKETIDTILVPVDFSDCSLGGLNYAIEFAKKFAARILLLHVVDLGPILSADGYAMYDISACENSLMKNAQENMRAFVRAVKFDAVPHQTMVVAGGSVDRICAVARAEKVDLIITATHGRTGLPHLLIGSAAEVMVRYAPCPVLVVPSHPEIRAANVRNGPRSRRASPPKSPAGNVLTRRGRKLIKSPPPERRQTNKFRETHRAIRRTARITAKQP